jgi:hypothetical protein
MHHTLAVFGWSVDEHNIQAFGGVPVSGKVDVATA